MAAISKAFSVGDTVWVRYPYTATTTSVGSGFVPASRVVTAINFIAASDECIVQFSNGNEIQDGAVVRVYTTQALCATAIVTHIIASTLAVVALDPTQSAVSTAGGVATALRRGFTA